MFNLIFDIDDNRSNIRSCLQYGWQTEHGKTGQGLVGVCKYKGIEVFKVFEEHISGAKKNDERPVLCEAMEYCKANRIGILLVSELSRLGRNAFEVLASVKKLIDCGINLYIQRNSLYYWTMKDIHPSLPR